MLTINEIEQNRSEMIELLSSTNRKGIDDVLKFMEGNDFYRIPASVRHHGNYEGGLAEHSLCVFKEAERMAGEQCTAERRNTLIIAALLHDLCKVGCYGIKRGQAVRCSNGNGGVKHGVRSVELLKKLGLELTEEEEMAIRWHMGKYTTDYEESKDVVQKEFDNICERYPLAKTINAADGIAAHHSNKFSASYESMHHLNQINIKYHTDMKMETNQWIAEFKSASEARDYDKLHALRIAVYEDTLRVVNKDFSDDAQFRAAAKFYDHELPAVQHASAKNGRRPQVDDHTLIEVWEEDTLVAAKMLQCEGYKPAVLNLASRRNPGGGVRDGLGAQEENLFRRTNLFRAMYQFARYAECYGLKRSFYQYPMDRNWGGVYTPQATVIKGPESEGYPLLDEPYKVDVVSVAAINLSESKEEGLNTPSLIEGTKNKMRTIYRIALQNGNDSLVLGAFGCGAFKNPPAQIAKLFHETLEEPEFKDAFSMVVFAILDNHNSFMAHNPEGNLIPFKREFE
jgi:uncharacterized protein (TIGR02452 family)